MNGRTSRRKPSVFAGRARLAEEEEEFFLGSALPFTVKGTAELCENCAGVFVPSPTAEPATAPGHELAVVHRGAVADLLTDAWAFAADRRPMFAELGDGYDIS